jgi:hypothetical protein
MSGMALRPLSARELADAPTLFASFMGRGGTRHRTVRELLEIYRERSKALTAAADRADDLRVDRFMADMARNRWTSDLVMRIGVFDHTTFLIDGTHRGIAYLACREDGISSERLPALHVDC